MPEEKPTDTSQPARAASSAPPRWRRHLVGLFVVAYVAAQVGIPAIGLYAAHTGDGSSSPFSWHMFSRLPTDGE